MRHGETVWNTQGRWQGWLDSPLTDLGIAQAKGLAEKLRDTPIGAVFCSDTGRAIETARILAAPHSIEPQPVQALRERFYGGYESLNAAEIERKYPGTRFAVSGKTREDWRPPEGETMGDVRARLSAFIAKLVREFPGKTVLNVTHSGIVRLADSIARREPLDAIWHRVPPNCCVFVIESGPRGRFKILHDFEPERAAPEPLRDEATTGTGRTAA